VLDVQRILALAHDVVLMEHVTQEVPVIQLSGQACVEFRRQVFHPRAVIAA